MPESWGKYIERTRLRLAATRAPLLLAALGAVAGLLSGIVIVAFRSIVDLTARAGMPLNDPENFEGLPIEWRIALPIGGALLLGGVFSALQPERRQTGLVHVLNRLQFHDGAMPFRNIVVQFFGGIVSLISGHSVGRESPSIHLGAAVSSQLAQRFSLPNNVVRIMVACGTAAGISASFNTPLAGVIFAMEVVMMEYTLAGFTPVILAAVVAAAISHSAYGDNVVFLVPAFDLVALWELLVITLLGILVGGLAAFFTWGTRVVARSIGNLSVFVRFVTAGFVCAVLAVFVPEVLGLGYDTVNHVILGDIAVTTLVVILIAKMCATAFCVGAGMPGGLIGPILLVGACAGGTVGMVLAQILETPSSSGLFALMGMGAMMSAMLQAPLAALLALLELTSNPNLIMPAMLAVVSANLTYKEVFERDSVFVQMLGDAGVKINEHPLAKSLARVGVTAVMNSQIASCEAEIDRQVAEQVIARNATWLSVRAPGQAGDNAGFICPVVDLVRYLDEMEEEATIDLREIPAQRLTVADVHMQSTLLGAHELLAKTGSNALRVVHRGRRVPGSGRVLGVVLPRDIETYYSYRPPSAATSADEPR